jgi:FkbM family methyltransferase
MKKRLAMILSDLGANPGLLLTYLRLRLKVFLDRWQKYQGESFCGYRIIFPSYQMFFVFFREIFVHEIYGFTSASASPLIFDCGANIGMASLYFRMRHPQARIIAFDPSKTIAPYLLHNIEKHGIDLKQCAIGPKDDTLLLYPCKTASCGDTLSPAIAKAFGSTQEPYPVEVVRLSTYITETVDMLKLDVEGVEYGVLRELRDSGALKHVQRLVFEHHPDEPDNDIEDIRTLLREEGYLLEERGAEVYSVVQYAERAGLKE